MRLRYDESFPELLRPTGEETVLSANIPQVFLDHDGPRNRRVLAAYTGSSPVLESDTESARWQIYAAALPWISPSGVWHELPIPERGDLPPAPYIARLRAEHELLRLRMEFGIVRDLDDLADDELPSALALPRVLTEGQYERARRSIGASEEAVDRFAELEERIREIHGDFPPERPARAESLTALLVRVLATVEGTPDRYGTLYALADGIRDIVAGIEQYPLPRSARFYER